MFSPFRKMNILMLAYAALLFVVLTPGVLLRLPSNGSKMTVALTHGAIFGVVWYFTNKMVSRASYEGFQDVMTMKATPKATSKATPKATPKATGRVSMNSPEIQAAMSRVDDATNRLRAIEEKYNSVAQMAQNMENEFMDAQKQVKNAEQQLRVAQGLPPTEPIRMVPRKPARI
jgi:hypothetical protein